MNPCPCCTGRDDSALLLRCSTCLTAYVNGESERCHADRRSTVSRRRRQAVAVAAAQRRQRLHQSWAQD